MCDYRNLCNERRSLNEPIFYDASTATLNTDGPIDGFYLLVKYNTETNKQTNKQTKRQSHNLRPYVVSYD